MHHPIFGHSFAVLVARILLSGLLFNFLNEKKTSAHKYGKDAGQFFAVLVALILLPGYSFTALLTLVLLPGHSFAMLMALILILLPEHAFAKLMAPILILPPRHSLAVLMALILLLKFLPNFPNNGKDADASASGLSIVPTETSSRVSGSLTTPIETSSSASATARDNFDVSLNFRGSGSQEIFVNCLYDKLTKAGICSVRDDRGEELDPDLMSAIYNSKIMIPILSVNCGSNKQYLDKLVQTTACKDDNKWLVVLPIFYKGEPAHLRSFGDTFHTHDPMIKEKWKQAVAKISSLKGWEAKGHEEQLVELIVRKVLIELKKALELVYTKNLVGIKSPMKEVMAFVDNSSCNTRYVVIHGRGGVGKTTLAKVIYNELSTQGHYYSSFIADVRESCYCNGIVYLQNQLILDVLKAKFHADNEEQGKRLISSKFRDKRVLIVLDDVSTTNQLEALVGERNWFGSRSRIIVTTRAKSVLDWAKVDDKYDHKEMDEDEAKILFARHAFGRDSSPSNFEILSGQLVSAISRFPLTLEVIGSYLCGKSKASWEKTIQKLQNFPQAENSSQAKVRANLMIVYEALEPEQKVIFQDIACFLVGSDERSAPYMWDVGDFNPVLKIQELIHMSLIKIGDNHELRMHDELRNLGRKIARKGSCNKLGKGKTLWHYEEASKVLQGIEGTENIRALSLDKGNSKKAVGLDSSDNVAGQGSQNYESEQFRNLLRLRFLHVRDANFIGNFNNVFSQLRWLRWERCPKNLTATEFAVKELAVADLSRNMITDNWQGWSSIMSAEKLKVLNLTYCRYLETTFFLSAFVNLETLILRNCVNLKEIDSSIRCLKTLESLDLSGCLCLVALPEDIGELQGLKELLLDGTQIQVIPSFIGSLKKLEILSANECKLLPESLHSTTEPLPNSIEFLVNLRCLSLRSFHNLSNIPPSINRLESLTELLLTGTDILDIPESIGKLHSLEVLNISRTKITVLPGAIGSLRKLQELDASWCLKLTDVSSICNLSSLQHLNLLRCIELKLLLKLPSSLKVVGITCKDDKLPSFSHLIHLKQLKLYRCMFLKCIPKLPVTPLELEVGDCEALQLKTSKGFKVSLKRLDIIRCNEVGKLDLSQVDHLRVLYARDCENICEIEGLDKLDYLRSLTIQRLIAPESDNPRSDRGERAHHSTH